MIEVERLDWDDWKIEHISRHRVSQEDVENACYSAPVLFKQSYKDHLVILESALDGRILAVIIGAVPHEPNGVYYVFTARPADRTERRFFHQARGGPIK
jgi:uncharacterized DUF497 family protein